MTPIFQAAMQGYDEKEILQFIGNLFPKAKTKIRQATSAGYTVSEILKFLNSDIQHKMMPNATPNEIEAANTEHLNKFARGLIGKAGMALGALGLVQAAPNIAEGIKNIFKGPKPMGGAPIQPSPKPTIPPAVPAAPITPEDQERATSQELFAKATPEFKQWAKDKLEQGEATGNMAQMLQLYEKEQKKKEKGTLEGKIIQDVEGMQTPQAPQPPRIAGLVHPKIEKGSIVATPSGEVGELKDVRKHEGLLDDAGKLKKVTIKDLKQPDETVVQTVTRLLEMPEIDKSSIINYWSYDDEANELFLMFHNGETYKYKNIPPELIDELREAAVNPKTTGANQFGAWSPEDELSRGATFINKIRNHEIYKPTKKGQPKNPNYLKLIKGYDYWKALRK